MRVPLAAKILAAHVVVVGVTVPVIWLVFDRLAANYFMVLMKQFNIDPKAVEQMFLQAGHRYLLAVTAMALAGAIVLSLLLTRRLLAPLHQMIGMTTKIAAGDYTSRVPVDTTDEVGELATAFNRMADSLARVEQLRKTMVNDVAHELRTPLTNMRGYLEALKDGVIPPSARLFESLDEEAMRIVRLVEDLGLLAEADAARATLRKEPVRAGDLVGRMLDLFRAAFDGKRITVTSSLDGLDEPVEADPDALAQVIRNLLQNAVQYTPAGGHVAITGERGPAGMTLTVANSGDGIAATDPPFIFERFYRGEKSRSREHGGAGIGLAIVKELVEGHGGTVGAASTANETRVWFTLPGAGLADDAFALLL